MTIDPPDAERLAEIRRAFAEVLEDAKGNPNHLDSADHCVGELLALVDVRRVVGPDPIRPDVIEEAAEALLSQLAGVPLPLKVLERGHELRAALQLPRAPERGPMPLPADLQAAIDEHAACGKASTWQDVLDEINEYAEHHRVVARSRRDWIDAATAVLGPEWNAGPDELREALAAMARERDELRKNAVASWLVEFRAACAIGGALGEEHTDAGSMAAAVTAIIAERDEARVAVRAAHAREHRAPFMPDFCSCSFCVEKT